MKLKVCGVRTLEMLRACETAGVDFVGINFVPTSRRLAQPDFLRALAAEPVGTLRVGVFQNQPIELIRDYVQKYHLAVVQLHGDEPVTYAEAFPQIVKAALPQHDAKYLQDWATTGATLLADGPRPGSGTAAGSDFLQLVTQLTKTFAIAGGVNTKIAPQLMTDFPGAAFLDTASGVETDDTFDPEKMKQLTSLCHSSVGVIPDPNRESQP